MFYIADSALINTAQWLVRQVELLTPVSHKNMNRGLLFINLFFAIVFLLEIIKGLIEGSIFPLFFIFMSLNQKEVHKMLKEEEVNETVLPKCIYERKFQRVCNLLTLFSFLFVVSMMFNKLQNLQVFQEIKTDFIFVSSVFVGSSFIIVVAEYFLCTMPLPPGEKERQKLEREMKKTAPQGAS
jgi:hypothetical protein